MTRFLLPIALLAACGAPEKQPVEPDQTEANLPAAVEATPEKPEFPGVVTSRNTQVLVAEFPGRIERLFIHSGQRVRAGEPIARLDDSDLKQQVEAAREQENAARADAGAAGAQAAAAAQKLKLESRLARSGISAQQSVRNVRAELNSLNATTGGHSARAKASRAERERLEQMLGKAETVAPFDGVVMMVKVKEGEAAQKGTPIARVFDPRDLMIRFAVPKDQRDTVQPGRRVELRIEGVDRAIWATVERIADEAPPLNFAVVEADIDDSKLAPDEVRVTAQGRVRIADAKR